MSPVRRLLFASVGLCLLCALPSGCGGKKSKSPAVPADSLHVSCLQKPDPGPCRAAKPAYFYDYQTDSCRRFNWGGCQGNVPFATLDQCLRMCRGGG